MLRTSVTAAWRKLGSRPSTAIRKTCCQCNIPSSIGAQRFLSQASESSVFDGKHVAIVGAGAMAQAMMAGLLRSQVLRTDQITVTDIHQRRLDLFHEKYGVKTTTNNVDAVEQADLIVLAIKPQSLRAFADDVASHVHDDDLVISIMAGCTIATLQQTLKCEHVVRSMPNTPAMVGNSMTVWTCPEETSQEHRDMTSCFVRGFGKELFVGEERYMDMVTALSGTGPAYFSLIMEAMIDSGVHLGLPRNMAKQLVVETLFGTVTLARETDQHPALLRESITSPGGTSAAALHACERGNLRSVLSDSVWAAYRRSLEMGGMDSNLGPGRSVRQTEMAELTGPTLQALSDMVTATEKATESLSNTAQESGVRGKSSIKEV
eukprot:m.39656 g.39656  ORF g.39656 m.39656 type:complete len:377 (+) comp12690_c0_seq1:72-1202(+)